MKFFCTSFALVLAVWPSGSTADAQPPDSASPQSGPQVTAPTPVRPSDQTQTPAEAPRLGLTASQLGPIMATGTDSAYVSAEATGHPTVFIGSDVNTYGIVGTFSNHPLGFRTANVLRMNIDTSGNVGIGTTSPTARLDVRGTGGNVLDLYGTGTHVRHYNAATSQKMYEYLDDTNNTYTFYSFPGLSPMVSLAYNSGSVGIGTTNPSQAKLQVESTSGTSVSGSTNSGTGVYGASASGFGVIGVGGNLPLLIGAGVWGQSSSGFGVWGQSSGAPGVFGMSTSGAGVSGLSSSGAGVLGDSSSGVGVTAHSGSNNLVEGYSTATGLVRKFHISNDGTYTAGSDFAEALPARGDRAGYEPGDVLIASADAPGQVEKARRPYDPRVLGVHSTRPGMLGAEKHGMSRVDPDDVPVAIVGIVPTKASAANGPILVGDLLTTSSTPGHAMRCANRAKCVGAVVGKALEPLTGGTGVIKVLVMLR